jgi:hypothetical protein
MNEDLFRCRYVFSAVGQLLVLTLALLGCEHQDPRGSTSTAATASVQQRVDFDAIETEVLELDKRLTDVYRRHDAQALLALVAPEYYGDAGDFEWDHDTLMREFPKIRLSDLRVERRHVKRLTPDIVQIDCVQTMQEVYDGQDISGRYWTSGIWVHRDGRWLLLVEQEIPLPAKGH